MQPQFTPNWVITRKITKQIEGRDNKIEYQWILYIFNRLLSTNIIDQYPLTFNS